MIIQKSTNPRISTFDPNNFAFGNTFIDHMIICEYENGKWGDVKLIPYGPIGFTPAMMGVNYGQACFEGMKAYKDKDGQVFLFRPEKNFQRINKSAKRLAIPEISEEIFMEGLKALVDIDRDWIPQGEGTSLYIRPLLFATEEALKARISEKYMFAIVATPAKAIILLQYPLKSQIIIPERQVEAWVLQKLLVTMLRLSIQHNWL